LLPDIGPEVVGASYCPLDGHVNSLRLFRTLHTAINARGVAYLPGHPVEAIAQEGGEFRLSTPRGEVRAGKVALAAGNANMRLAPMVGLEAPMKPERGQIVVTERLRPFLNHPVVTLRQTDEGTVMIGDSKGRSTDPSGLTLGVRRHRGRARGAPVPAAAQRQRGADLERDPGDDPGTGSRSTTESESHPGAFVLCCHSGVHAVREPCADVAPMIARGALDRSLVAPSARGGSMFKRLGEHRFDDHAEGRRQGDPRPHRRYRRSRPAGGRHRPLPHHAGDRRAARALLPDGRVFRLPGHDRRRRQPPGLPGPVQEGMLVETQLGKREAGR
jgi:hypothetical protein